MKNRMKWIVLGLLSLAIFVLTFMKTPEAITSMLENISKEVKTYSAFVHILFLVVIGLGLLVEKIRNSLFSLFIAFLSLSATIISVKYVIAPNVIIFGMFFVLIIHAYFAKKLTFDLRNIALVNLFSGILGLVFGFWYLHWVESPVWLNAFLYSPLGAVNCPTMVTICGFLCLSQKPRSTILEAAVALITLYFGFFGIFRLGAYVDVALIICALFLIVRLGSYLTYEHTFGETKEEQGHPGDVAENRDFISLSHEMEIPMAEIARNVGYVDQLSLRQFKRWNQRIRFIDFINVPKETCQRPQRNLN